jgi:hypothetical protein
MMTDASASTAVRLVTARRCSRPAISGGATEGDDKDRERDPAAQPIANETAGLDRGGHLEHDGDMDLTADPSVLAAAWADAQGRLPDGWSLDSLRCASTGLDPASRSEEWVAVAVGPDGEERTHRDAEPIGALGGLVRSFVPTTTAGAS